MLTALFVAVAWSPGAQTTILVGLNGAALFALAYAVRRHHLVDWLWRVLLGAQIIYFLALSYWAWHPIL